MKKLLFVGLICFLAAACNEREAITQLRTVFEDSDSLSSASYEEAIAWWKKLEETSPYVCMQTFGRTDVGEPLHAVIISNDKNFNAEKIRESQKVKWMINNAIHPGEPDGVDASMLFIRELLSSEHAQEQLEQCIIIIVPFYNTGGAINRNCCSRANQNGPTEYGFRGNARNLDLNRDFAKLDSKNAQSLVAQFHIWDIDVYLETHVSNGADYPYTMTYLLSHPNKLTPPLNSSIVQDIEQPLLDYMKDANDPMIPYVNVFGTSPDSGYAAFYDQPRYSTGFTALFNAYGLLTETHMLKPFSKRVRSTWRFFKGLLHTINTNHESIKNARIEAAKYLADQSEFALDYKTDRQHPTKLLFKGYRAYFDSSEVTNTNQLYYDRSSQWEREIDYFNKLIPTKRVQAPSYYLVPRSWGEVIDRLKLNNVSMHILKEDTSIDATTYRIADFETKPSPYEGHYHHFNTNVEKSLENIELRKNEYYIISTQQPSKRMIIEMLEPEAPDSYFNWNFYDEILQQKEGFSSYVFEPESKQMLSEEKHSQALKQFISEHPEYSNNAFAKLNFLYERSKHYEIDRYMIYPVYRIE
ncbi:MAG: M14 family zinc carboxypeptidase [Salibacteraceae bacterium]